MRIGTFFIVIIYANLKRQNLKVMMRWMSYDWRTKLLPRIMSSVEKSASFLNVPLPKSRLYESVSPLTRSNSGFHPSTCFAFSTDAKKCCNIHEQSMNISMRWSILSSSSNHFIWSLCQDLPDLGMGMPSFYRSQTPLGCSEQSQVREIHQPGWRTTNSVISKYSFRLWSLLDGERFEIPWRTPLLIHRRSHTFLPKCWTPACWLFHYQEPRWKPLPSPGVHHCVTSSSLNIARG